MACGESDSGFFINEKDGTLLTQVLLPKFISREFCADACCVNSAVNKMLKVKVKIAFIAFSLMVENSFFRGRQLSEEMVD